MSLIRADARTTLWRLRESLTGFAVLVLGLYWGFGTFGILQLVGYVLIAVGLGLIGLGVQRARFRVGAGGLGVVQVDEGQITYFGPLCGGAVAIVDLERLTLDHTARPAHWVLEQNGQPPLHVPLNAEGSDALFDAFTALPGLRTERMLAQMRQGHRHAVVIWERSSLRPAAARLH